MLTCWLVRRIRNLNGDNVMPDKPMTYVQLRKAKQPKAKPLYDLKRGTAAQRGYGGSWPKLAKAIIDRDPICQAPGCEQPSTEADHITPKAKGGTNELSNLQGLCKPCHSRKTANEDGGFGR